MSTEHATSASAPRVRADSDSYDNIEPWLATLASMDPSDPARERLRQDILTTCLPLGEHIARRYTGRGVDYEDLVQVAAMGVVLAVDRFDPGYGAPFLGFAIPTIMGEVKRYFRDSTWAVRVPRSLKELQQRLITAIPQLAQDLGHEPTARELAAHLQVDLLEITQALIAANSYHADSLDTSDRTDDDGVAFSPLESLATTDPGYCLIEDSISVGPLLAALPDTERAILIMRFGQDKSQAEIAQILGVSQMQVSRILARLLSGLRAGVLRAA
ncbi:SigB/SigF/SigG family RNA polymerase sigma factor [Nocardia sp. NBC_01327]|uniref:SigB/SigF/SigG family RNA polymerase sigma factor n=1 Tax=Nocardia sp. NBC_01327 TaxID=2903593 RepID=UPI002E0F56CE|nr:SigB/SigF/SigG family RNA polymerase sigma factor [Nocardia sp. NBC_01327]